MDSDVQWTLAVLHETVDIATALDEGTDRMIMTIRYCDVKRRRTLVVHLLVIDVGPFMIEPLDIFYVPSLGGLDKLQG